MNKDGDCGLRLDKATIRYGSGRKDACNGPGQALDVGLIDPGDADAAVAGHVDALFLQGVDLIRREPREAEHALLLDQVFPAGGSRGARSVAAEVAQLFKE